MNDSEQPPVGRRRFLGQAVSASVAAGAAIGLVPRPASARIMGANDRIRVAIVGTGRRTLGMMKHFEGPDVQIVAISDVYQPNLDKAAANAPSAKRAVDFRRILDDREVDAVVIGTPDHWHAVQTIRACEAGKDVYVEKPISVSVHEGRRMVEAANRYGRVVQVGTQQRSGIHFQQAVEVVRSGRLGKVTQVRTWNFSNDAPEGIGNPPDSAPPPELDWDLWLGPAPKVQYNPNRFGVAPDRWSTFRYFWDYAGGMMTDWGVHWLDIVHWAMDVDAPQRVAAVGGKFCLLDNRETPDTLLATYQYPGWICSYENRVCNSDGIDGRSSGILFHGTDATMYLNRQGYEITPQGEKGPVETVENTNDHTADHIADFLRAVRERGKPICDIETGHRSTSVALLGNVAYRSARSFIWDGKTESVVGDKIEDRLLRRTHRQPFTLA